LGITARLGRTFLAADESTDPRVVVLSEGFRKRDFGSDAAVIGRAITIGGRQQAVIVAREATARPRFRTILVAAFALLALVLAMTGVFGVLAYSVQQRRREFGVRLALGATGRHVRGLVLAEGGRVIAAGVAAGLPGAGLLGQAMSGFLFGVQPRDPITFAGVVTVIG